MTQPNTRPQAQSAPVQMSDVIASYDGMTNNLTGASLTLPAGSITGLLGRNGAGKTTLMRAMLGLLKISAGESLLFGEPAFNSSGACRARVGYVPQSFNEFGIRSVREVLYALSGFYPNWNHELVQQLQAEWGLDEQHLNQLSVGEKQKVAILMAMGPQPDLLVLDEPVASLDPAARREFMQKLVEMNVSQAQTVLLSSHITSDIERIASHIAIMDQGRIVLHMALDELKEQVKKLSFEGPPPADLAVLAQTGSDVWVQHPDADYPGLRHREDLILEDFFLAATR